jgi:dihydroxyacetone kinase DhaKLM complex PTS-EIIA-like component DhaM
MMCTNFKYAGWARELFEHVQPSGTNIFALIDPRSGLQIAQILKRASLEPNKDSSFDSAPWDALPSIINRAHTTPVDDFRIVAQITAGCSGGQLFGSTGEYVGALVNEVFGNKKRLVFARIGSSILTQIEARAFHWWKLRICNDELLEVPVTEGEFLVMKMILGSPAMQVPLKPGTRPKEFHLDKRGRINSQMTANA